MLSHRMKRCYSFLSPNKLWHFCQLYVTSSSDSTMSGLQISSYSENIREVTSVEKYLAIPILKQPDEILVRVYSGSINPIDINMIQGYGSTYFNFLRKVDGQTCDMASEFPIILGRDFSGVVVSAGPKVPKHLSKKGTPLIAAKWPFASNNGCLAEYAVIKYSHAALKPKNLPHTEAAAIPYAGLTAYHALGSSEQVKNKKILIHGASGGVGFCATQLCKIWGASLVSATCRSNKAYDILNDFGAEPLFELSSLTTKYDIIIDCVEESGSDSNSRLLKLLQSGGKLVRLRTPILKNGMEPTRAMLQDLSKGVQYGFFQPNGKKLTELASYADRGLLTPVIQKVVPLEEGVTALEDVQDGPTIGKTIIRLN